MALVAAPEAPPNAFRGYIPRRGKAHWVDSVWGITAFCGLIRFDGWYGTGSQEEYEEAARRNICSLCARRAAWRFGS